MKLGMIVYNNEFRIKFEFRGYFIVYAFLKGEIPYILVFEYNIFRHTSYFNFEGTVKYDKPRLQRGNAAV
jgi:hypothetical protein